MEEKRIKEKIKPIYKELQGYLSQVPLPKTPHDAITSPAVWEQFNNTIDELNACSEENYDKFKVSAVYREEGYQQINLVDYRQKLGGLISRLQAEFFSSEPEPFSGSPSTIITQNQQQTQSLHVQMLLEFQSLIDKKLPELKAGSKEKSFLEKVKKSLPTITSVIELIKLILSVAGNLGLTPEEISKILHP